MGLVIAHDKLAQYSVRKYQQHQLVLFYCILMKSTAAE